MNKFDKIYIIARKIPFGRVTTYGQLAMLADLPRAARLVGYAMSRCPYDDVPCHRVVNSKGGLADAFSPNGKESHRQLLEMEGVEFLSNGSVNMKKYFWFGEE